MQNGHMYACDEQKASRLQNNAENVRIGKIVAEKCGEGSYTKEKAGLIYGFI